MKSYNKRTTGRMRVSWSQHHSINKRVNAVSEVRHYPFRFTRMVLTS